MSKRIAVTRQTYESICKLSDASGLTMQEVGERAVEYYRREQILTAANAGYAALRADPAAWQAWEQEIAEWDVTLLDGLA